MVPERAQTSSDGRTAKIPSDNLALLKMSKADFACKAAVLVGMPRAASPPTLSTKYAITHPDFK